MLRAAADESTGGSLSQSLQRFWETFGSAFLRQSHEYYLLNRRQGCTEIRFEDFRRRYRQTVAALLEAWGVRGAQASAPRVFMIRTEAVAEIPLRSWSFHPRFVS